MLLLVLLAPAMLTIQQHDKPVAVRIGTGDDPHAVLGHAIGMLRFTITVAR